MRLLIQTRKLTLDVRFTRTDVDQPEEPQPRGDVYASTERSYADEPAELRVGFSGSRSWSVGRRLRCARPARRTVALLRPVRYRGDGALALRGLRGWRGVW